MTNNQLQAIWELCRQGLPLMADEAASHWESGEVYQLDTWFHLPRETEGLIDRCNWENRRRCAPITEQVSAR